MPPALVLARIATINKTTGSVARDMRKLESSYAKSWKTAWQSLKGLNTHCRKTQKYAVECILRGMTMSVHAKLFLKLYPSIFMRVKLDNNSASATWSSGSHCVQWWNHWELTQWLICFFHDLTLTLWRERELMSSLLRLEYAMRTHHCEELCCRWFDF